jgi:molybdenum cofactor sulfurtransferase
MEEEKFTEEFSEEEKKKIGNEFSRLKDSVYLDAAGSMIYGENQIRQITETLTTGLFCNPHTSKTTDTIVDSVRFR